MTEVNLDKVVPVGGNEAGNPAEPTPAATPTPEPAPAPAPAAPAPSNAERAEAKAAKEAADKPAKEAAEADAPPEEDPKAAELDTTVWGDAGDEVANSVLTTLQNSGVTPETAKALLWDAVESGDPTKVDRDALVEAVGKSQATLVMAGIENVTSRNNAKIAEVVGIANKAAGSPEGWDKARTWAKANLPKDDLEEYTTMLDGGGEKAAYAAGRIVSRYNADPKNTSLDAGKDTIEPDNKGKPTVEGITRRQYGELLDRAHRRGATQAEFNSLRAQRQAGIAKGL